MMISRILCFALVLLTACGADSDDRVAELEAQLASVEEELAAESEQTTALETTTTTTTSTTTTTTTTTIPQTTEELLSDVVCEIVGDSVDEDPDMLVGSARVIGQQVAEEIEGRGDVDTELVISLANETCERVNIAVFFGYSGHGPFLLDIDFTNDRGACSPAGDLGGVLSSNRQGASYDVRLLLEYVVDGVLEHDTTESLTVSADQSAAYEFFIPRSVPSGGTCNVTVESISIA